MFEDRPLLAGPAIWNEDVTLVQRDEARRDEARQQNQTLEALVRQHARLVYRIAYAVLRRHHDAEDATQETFLRMLRYSARLANVNDPKTWLARIAWRVAVDRHKHQGGKREVPLEDPDKSRPDLAAPGASSEQAVQGLQIGARLERLIAALPEKLRQPLILSAIEEMSPREVAATLGINEAAVRSRVFRARQILREKMTALV